MQQVCCTTPCVKTCERVYDKPKTHGCRCDYESDDGALESSDELVGSCDSVGDLSLHAGVITNALRCELGGIYGAVERREVSLLFVADGEQVSKRGVEDRLKGGDCLVAGHCCGIF